MFTFKDSDIKDKVDSYISSFSNGVGGILLYSDFIKNVLKKGHAKALAEGYLKYPYEVNIPRSSDDMLKGDFSPLRTLQITEPIYFDDAPMWWRSSLNEVYLRFGNIRGDSRKPSEYSFNDTVIHGMLGGITGFGKSVTLNSIIFSMCFEYAPWEIDLTLLDAKAADIKRFGSNKLPHVSTVGATFDSDYMRSVLEAKQRDLVIRNSVISKAGAKDIIEFRKKTGLVLPRNVIIFDEVQSAFSTAGKNLAKMVLVVDSVARLGRSAGCHMYLATQGVASDIPANTYGQFKLRCCLGATADVSEKILGNDAAKLIQTKGKMFVNTNVDGKSSADNIEIKVPFQPSSGSNDEFTPQSKFLYAMGEKFNFVRPLNFYDENDMIYESQFENYLDKVNADKNHIILGEPGFVLNDTIPAVNIPLFKGDFENIVVYTHNAKDAIRFGRTIRHNFSRYDYLNAVISGDQEMTKEMELQKLPNVNIYNIDSARDVKFTALLNTILYRKLMLSADNLISESTVNCSQSGKETLEAMFPNRPTVYNSGILQSRVEALFYLLKTDLALDFNISDSTKILADLSKAEQDEARSLGLKDMNVAIKKDLELLKVIKTALTLYVNYNFLDRVISSEDFPPTFMWMIGYTKIRLLGRVPEMRTISKLKDFMLDAHKANVRFIIFTDNMSEMSDIAMATRFFITDGKAMKQANKMNCSETYPESTLPQLAVLSESTTGDCLKFKKLFFDGEVLV